jgi:muconate cycloisomerase
VPPAAAADAAVEQVARGFKTIKIKIGHDAVEDAERVKAVRQAVGDGVMLRVDANAGYDRATAMRVFRRIEKFGLEWIEQPLPGWDLEGLAMLASKLDTPIAVDESMYTPYVATVCAASAVPCFLGGCIETTVGTAAAAHFYAATPNVISAAEIHGSPFYVDDVVEQPFTIEDGCIEVPRLPGLGVVVNEEKVAKYRIDF